MMCLLCPLCQVFIFFGETFLSMNWAIVADILLVSHVFHNTFHLLHLLALLLPVANAEANCSRQL